MIVHVVLNSHLAPIWLWNLEQGLAATRALRNPVRTPLAPRRPDTRIAPPAVLS